MNSRQSFWSQYLFFAQVIFFTALLLYLGRVLFIPLFFGLLIALVMYPATVWMERKGFSRAVATGISILIVLFLFLGLLALLFWQVTLFTSEAPVIRDKLMFSLHQLENWLNSHLGMAGTAGWTQKLAGNLGSVIETILKSTANTLFMLFLIPVYMALFLYHRNVFVQFLRKATPASYQGALDKILHDVVHTYARYIKGMIMVYLIVGLLNSLGLWALGVQHALLYGVLCAIMTIIPYAGILVSALLPISVVWLQTGNIWYPLGVVAVFSFVQYLEANVIFPKVVGSQLNVSTLAMLVAIIIGGIIWGVAGMVLFIPFVAILKIVSEHLPGMEGLYSLLNRR